MSEKKNERKSKGVSSSNEHEKDDKSKMMSGSKDLCGDSTRKRINEKANNNDVTFIVLQKNMRSMHSSERIEEMICELEQNTSTNVPSPPQSWSTANASN